jgi:hypothetical protein
LQLSAIHDWRFADACAKLVWILPNPKADRREWEKGTDMPVRKTRRTKRRIVRTLADYSQLEFSAHYQRKLSDAEFHAEIFSTDASALEFYREHRAIFGTMRTVTNCRDANWRHYHKPGERHFLWWSFDSPEQRDPNVREYFQLKATGMLTPDEIGALRAQAVGDNERLHYSPWHSGLPFRRSWMFWEFVSGAPRDESIFESSQLAAMNELTFLEKEIIADPQRATGQRQPTILPRTKFYYLDAAERRLFGLSYGHNPKTEAMLCELE